MPILIISERNEPSTNSVVQWLHYYKQSFFRINQEDAFWFKRSISNKQSDLSIWNKNEYLNGNEVCSLWHRRGSIKIAVDPTNGNTDPTMSKIRDFLIAEAKLSQDDIYRTLSESAVINITKSSQLNVNKLEILEIAAKCGLDIPNTIITNDKHQLLSFIKDNGRCIAKAIDSNFSLKTEDRYFSHFTTIIDYEDLQRSYGNYIFPCLVQQYIDKKFEIRTFVLNKSVYSMAIFSQQNERTKIDYRNVDLLKPNRVVPYKLPNDIEKKILDLFEMTSLKTGSVDIIFSSDKKYVFLEVNPVGQFGMVSTPCNYYLEKKIAEQLANETN